MRLIRGINWSLPIEISKIFGSGIYIARSPLGKYIILSACLLHVTWAVLLFVDPSSGSATPLSAIVILFHGKYPAIVGLLIVAGLAYVFLHKRAFNPTKPIRSFVYGILLFPQLWFLLISSEAAITAAINGYYFDYVVRPAAFILTDQLPVIVLTLLYATAVIEIGRNRIRAVPTPTVEESGHDHR